MCISKHSLFTTSDVELPPVDTLALQMLSHMWGGFQTLLLQTAHSRVSTANPALTTKVQGIILVKLKFASFPSKRDGHSRSRAPGLSPQWQ